ncbi:ribonucleases p mrp protein subunit pop3 kDa subunit [Favolaschia claudopus]|uniref:Ribonucleases p mrp protein subunit pop3 kDa subunit n=1 Tax=Favolaschia claudopus TaxID=2862362 RepID=A0AAW0EHK5_9AGAR
MSAKVHTNPSNRAKTRDALEKKVVFKSVLDSPFRVPWPSIPISVQETALEYTLSLLKDVGAYHSTRGRESRKGKQRSNDTRPNKRRKVDLELPPQGTDSILPEISAPAENSSIPRPDILSHLSIGLNAVTRRLDDQIRSSRKTVSLDSAPTVASVPPTVSIKVVMVCRADVDPSILIAHIPHEVAAYNSCAPPDPIKLVTFPKGAEADLAKAVGLRRVTVIAMDINTPGLDGLVALLDSVPTVTAPWLTSRAASATPVNQQLIPTHVKQLRTTAPKDMKLAKLLRVEGKAAAKVQNKSAKRKLMTKTVVVSTAAQTAS